MKNLTIILLASAFTLYSCNSNDNHADEHGHNHGEHSGHDHSEMNSHNHDAEHKHHQEEFSISDTVKETIVPADHQHDHGDSHSHENN